MCNGLLDPYYGLPQCTLLDWAPTGCMCLVVLVCFLSGPLVVCFSAAAAAPGSAPLSCCPWPCGSAPTPLRPAAPGHSPCHRNRLWPAGTRCTGQPATPACKGWKEPPWPGAQRWEDVFSLILEKLTLQKVEAIRIFHFMLLSIDPSLGVSIGGWICLGDETLACLQNLTDFCCFSFLWLANFHVYFSFPTGSADCREHGECPVSHWLMCWHLYLSRLFPPFFFFSSPSRISSVHSPTLTCTHSVSLCLSFFPHERAF